MASRKEYQALAAVINDLQHPSSRRTARIVAVKMVDWYAADNENFDRDRFYEACGIDADSATYDTLVYNITKEFNLSSLEVVA